VLDLDVVEPVDTVDLVDDKAVVADVPDEGDFDETDFVTTALAAAVVPGISWDIAAPNTAAVSAAPPVAAPVMRLTFLNAAALRPPGFRSGIFVSSFETGGSLWRNHTARAWQPTGRGLGARCESRAAGHTADGSSGQSTWGNDRHRDK